MCINQLFRPKLHIPMYGYGDCTKCMHNHDNSYCKGYNPIGVQTFYVGER